MPRAILCIERVEASCLSFFQHMAQMIYLPLSGHFHWHSDPNECYATIAITDAIKRGAIGLTRILSSVEAQMINYSTLDGVSRYQGRESVNTFSDHESAQSAAIEYCEVNGIPSLLCNGWNILNDSAEKPEVLLP